MIVSLLARIFPNAESRTQVTSVMCCCQIINRLVGVENSAACRLLWSLEHCEKVTQEKPVHLAEMVKVSKLKIQATNSK